MFKENLIKDTFKDPCSQLEPIYFALQAQINSNIQMQTLSLLTASLVIFPKVVTDMFTIYSDNTETQTWNFDKVTQEVIQQISTAGTVDGVELLYLEI